MDDLDSRFFRSILVGAAFGVPLAWIALTGLALLSGQSLLVSAGSAGPAAFFCGPFIGGLFTTSRVWSRAEAHDGDEVDDERDEPARLAA